MEKTNLKIQKKAYQKPEIEVTEFRFSEHIAASGSSCYWVGEYAYATAGCTTNLVGGHMNNA